MPDYPPETTASTQEANLQAIANAIRAKNGTTEPIPASEFAARILAIETGGSLPEGTHTITVTASDADGGTVSGGGVASEGMIVTVEAATNEGYAFRGWQEDGTLVCEAENYAFKVENSRNLTAGFEASASRVPEGYTGLEYIRNPNLGYIRDLGNIQTLTGYKLEMVMALPEEITHTNKRRIWGASYFDSSSSTKNVYYDMYLYYDPATYEIVFIYSSGGTKPNSSSITVSGGKFLITINMPEKNFTIGETTNELSSNAARSYNTVAALFAENYTSKGYNSSASTTYGRLPMDFKFYSLKITNVSTGVILHEFVPCIDPSSAVGVYDLSEDKFFASYVAAKPFVAGPEI